MTLAEIAVTIAALSAVAGVVGSETASPRVALRSSLLRDVARIGLSVGLFCVLPLVFRETSAAPTTVLRGCGALAGVTWLIGYLVYAGRVWRDPAQMNRAFWLGLSITTCGIMFFGSTAVAPGEGSPHRYVLGLLCWLAIAGLNFVSSAFGPSDAADDA